VLIPGFSVCIYLPVVKFKPLRLEFIVPGLVVHSPMCVLLVVLVFRSLVVLVICLYLVIVFFAV
jgi:hypothetical protein